MIDKELELYIRETELLNFSDPRFDSFLKDIDPIKSPKELAVDLYFLVRDSFLYDPYHLDLRSESLKASQVLPKKRAWCVEKATVLAACARRFNIPSRLGYAIVTNHIGVEKLIEYLGRKEIVFHGFVELYINDRWIKCTPTFDKNICRLANVAPLDWDGENDSLFHEYQNNERYMEYIHFYGHFDDVPVALMNSEMKKYYPHLFEKGYTDRSFSFYHEPI